MQLQHLVAAAAGSSDEELPSNGPPQVYTLMEEKAREIRQCDLFRDEIHQEMDTLNSILDLLAVRQKVGGRARARSEIGNEIGRPKEPKSPFPTINGALNTGARAEGFEGRGVLVL